MDPLINGIVNFQQATLGAKIDFAVARKILDVQQSNGSAAIKLIENADRNFNTAAATGLGSQIDVRA